MTALGKVAMKHVGRALVTATTALALTAAPAATAAPVQPDRPGLQEGLDGVVAAGAVGALAVVRDGHRAWRGNSGVAELGYDRAVPPMGGFGSAVLLRRSWPPWYCSWSAKGGCGWTTRSTRGCPGSSRTATRITVRHLLNHTSGLYDYRLTLALPPARSSWTTGGGPGPQPNRSSARRPSADVRTARFGVRVLEHQLPRARPDHRAGDRALLRQGDRAPDHPAVAVAPVPRCPARRRGSAGRIRTATRRWSTRRHPHRRLHRDEPVVVRRRWRHDFQRRRPPPLLRRTAPWTPARPLTCSTNEDAGARGGTYGLGLPGGTPPAAYASTATTATPCPTSPIPSPRGTRTSWPRSPSRPTSAVTPTTSTSLSTRSSTRRSANDP